MWDLCDWQLGGTYGPSGPSTGPLAIDGLQAKFGALLPTVLERAFRGEFWGERMERTMRERPYYSLRTGKNPSARLDLATLLNLFLDSYRRFDEDCYFQEAFGYDCVDVGEVRGTLGSDVEAVMRRRLRKPDLWPIREKCPNYSEDDLFDVTEFLYDFVSKPREGRYHGFNGCGWHYDTFDQQEGRDEFRADINEILRDYGPGYELSKEGQILSLPDSGLGTLLDAPLPGSDAQNVDQRVQAAIRKFRQRHSTPDDRRDAVRDLVDVLEFLKPRVQQVLESADERELFHIANKFGIRHHRQDQQTTYDRSIWYSWMFYYYLATIHACTRLIQKHGHNATTGSNQRRT